MSVRAPRKRRPYSRKRKRIAHSSPTTSWFRAASRQDKFGAHVPFGKHAAPVVCRSFSPKSAAPFSGSPGELARLAVGRKKSCIHKSPAEKESLRGIWSRRRDLRLWRRAPVHSAPRCAVCFPALCFWAAMRKLLTPVRTSTLKSRRNTFNKKQTGKFLSVFWSRRRDLNPRPLGPEPSALPNCATPRQALLLYQTELSFASVFHTAI